ncbi:MAG TPA: hypothetical protein PLH75_00325 [Amaricoccus sp.]|uniref:hypothetical protein n=1 Tax=Amaricoccus sp. TaxID=1872485 RepID=UPI001D72897B|nr:hypothetical protein [Amaricoccus sp.]MCB1375791.1 hypothetical protein [Paracoccaceae bacterium]MCB1403593.1 hypothetical protein [Paracoccaceae bacterium]HPG21213.1 hypothetical protein [Amaricoccus sp.]HRW16655.1 hypothetical protein [Amaricoccus sp.]
MPAATKAAAAAGDDEKGGPINVSISGDHIIAAYKLVRDDLATMFQDNPNRRVEFVVGNTTDLTWENIGTHRYAGEWVRGANPTEDLLPNHALGAALESDGGGAGGALAFRCDFPKSMNPVGLTALLVLFGYCPKTASDRVEGQLFLVPTVAINTFVQGGDFDEFVKTWCDKLESLGGDDATWSRQVSLNSKQSLKVVAAYSGGNDGFVATTISIT